ncbi:hypothetical protein BXZ70DRAFT_730695 [Cristinia sonorae]|uniref:Uncharacterized protein n=1 Tax=Cristinia sonorae TaxID=1940300 RepID=A0A8K0USR7_9AGAR|nr:hypothetical protein BXZ70DRAFT_730695 [Cristinia sonorae]
MSVWTDTSPLGVERQIALNILITHVFSGFALWEAILSIPYDWNAFRGRRGCKWGVYIVYMNCRHVFFCSIIATLVFVDMFAHKFVPHLAIFFQISGHVANGFAYAILALRLMIVWRKNSVVLLMIVCQLALWATTFAAFPRLIDGFQELHSHIRQTTTLLVVSTIMFIGMFWGLISSYRQHLVRMAHRNHTPVETSCYENFKAYCQMLWQESLHYFVVVWAAQMAEAVNSIPFLLHAHRRQTFQPSSCLDHSLSPHRRFWPSTVYPGIRWTLRNRHQCL